MSIRTNKMKAVPVLLKQLMTIRSKFHERGKDESFDEKLEKLRLDVNKIKDVFVRVKKNEEELLDISAEVYDHLRKLDRRKLDEDMDDICKRIKDSAHKLVPMDAFDDSSKEEDHKGGQIFHSSQPLQQPNQKSWIWVDYDRLDRLPKDCLSSLLIFPENAVIRKSNAINLWIGEGLLELYVREKNVDHPGYASLFRKTGIKRFVLKQKKLTLGDWDFGYFTHTIFNVGASYLNFRPQWVKEFPNLEVLQLGRWQDSPLHHIEVVSEEFLKELSNLTQLKYLSLRGISRIFELPSSIAQLERLLVLDLKACHNLETLPNDISSMKSLTHLILSQCCLLEEMPKGIEKLTNLEVLKGFVISTPGKTPCRISDLVNLKKLRQLSIHIGSGVVMSNMDFKSLGDIFTLEHLKISWSVSDTRYGNIQVIFPLHLRKLHLECFPGKSFRECWFDTSNLLQHIELNITGKYGS
ncbi:hypothetical protein PHAVU_008G066800 [Phaseolus vulgaris]|uniref:Disease resistance R13L4/SHOC-2-like LRR domain-containing protein n=1 Tax=Phaseolus vulgaris TaxID=3885 RepID=V7B2S4_PHAVU|nr:hypothetical protein PHAVU_008G066800g [Phaseolus vulgaris]ESW11880.1 hypothetical protein PHAVU_008G066800g [Phaseolus vulgaris]